MTTIKTRLEQLAKLPLETITLIVQHENTKRKLKLAPLGLSNSTWKGRERLIVYHKRGKAIFALRSSGRMSLFSTGSGTSRRQPTEIPTFLRCGRAPSSLRRKLRRKHDQGDQKHDPKHDQEDH